VLALLRARPLSTSSLRAHFRTRGAPPSPILASVSPRLRTFTEELSLERRSILEFVARCAGELERGARVLDAGAGNAPYRELFGHCDYVTTDWTRSVHTGARSADVIASLADLPLGDASFDAVVCTQVLEHVGDPRAVVAELNRVLRPGARLWLTVPLVWPLHEEPFDFFRYTPYSLRALLEQAGFVDVYVAPRNGYFATIAQLLRIAPDAVGWQDDRGGRSRARLFEDLRRLADQLEGFEDLDDRRIFPLGYQATARRPADAAEPTEARRQGAPN
jgi:SAM-dependent methyltransferase